MSWIFGYGSLMWRPGFDHLARHPATLHGWHRAFCRYSFRHRGTPEAPGMVAGLAPGGACRGDAFLVDEAREAAVLAYLDEREGSGYRRLRLPLEIERPNGALREEAWVYLPDEGHPSHVRALRRNRIVELIATGHGQSGTAHDYLIALIQELERLGAADPDLYTLLREVEAHQRARLRDLVTPAAQDPAAAP
jgi:cation transport protein ChaC